MTQVSIIERLSLASLGIQPDVERIVRPALLVGSLRSGNVRRAKKCADAGTCVGVSVHVAEAPMAGQGVTEGFKRYRRLGWLS
jgi:hypothetical protein